MKRLWTSNRPWIVAAVLLVCSHAQPLHAETQTWFGFQVGVSGGNAPPPPVVFRSEPRVIYVNDVHVVDDDRCDDDVFRADDSWWRMRSNHWYRASTWRGPWVGVDVRRVPERVLVVPAKHWKHHPRHSRRTVVVLNDRGRDRDRDRERRQDRREKYRKHRRDRND